jgi:hypothetical protein
MENSKFGFAKDKFLVLGITPALVKELFHFLILISITIVLISKEALKGIRYIDYI